MQETDVLLDISEDFNGAWSPDLDSSAERLGGAGMHPTTGSRACKDHDEDMPCDSARQGTWEGT
jgi:hypothetical protein